MAGFTTQATKTLGPREAEIDYIIDMIAELAKLARRMGEVGVAIHLEAIIAAKRASMLGEAG